MDFLQFLSPDVLQTTVANAGASGPVLYIAIIALSVVVSQIPGAPLAVMAGTLWSPLWAGMYTVVGGFTGAMMAYWLGHRVGEPLVKALTGKTLKVGHEQSTTALGLLIFVTRLLPVVSFDLVSYGAGMARLPLPIYAGATLFGMVPSTFLLTYMGDCIHVNGSEVWFLSALFIVLFMLLPLLVYRYNWLNVRSLIGYS